MNLEGVRVLGGQYSREDLLTMSIKADTHVIMLEEPNTEFKSDSAVVLENLFGGLLQDIRGNVVVGLLYKLDLCCTLYIAGQSGDKSGYPISSLGHQF